MNRKKCYTSYFQNLLGMLVRWLGNKCHRLEAYILFVYLLDGKLLYVSSFTKKLLPSVFLKVMKIILYNKRTMVKK